MRWQNLRRSSNVQDRRSMGGKTAAGGVGGVLLMAFLVYAMGGDPTSLLMEGVSRTIQSSTQRPSRLTEEQQTEQADFSAAVLGSTEDIWTQIYRANNASYQMPNLVLFAGAVDSACGMGQTAMGPFYCPLDQNVYLDLDFFYELEHKLDAPGDFARAYVIAHEVGHHVQNLQGLLKGNRDNEHSVRTELQADCYAGVWAHGIADFGALDEGDFDEAFHAAGQIGDDRLQHQSQGYVVPDSFTHGSAKQRMAWFNRGYESGDPAQCDTFSGKI